MGGRNRTRKSKSFAPWFQTIRAMPGLSVHGSLQKPLVTRNSMEAFLFMLTGIKAGQTPNNSTAMSDFNRTITVARRASEILKTAIAIVEKTHDVSHWSLADLWQAALTELSKKGPTWRFKVAAYASEEVMDVFIKARSDLSTAGRARQVASEDIQQFLDALDKFIDMKSQHNLRPRPRSRRRARPAPELRSGQAEVRDVQNHENASVGDMVDDDSDSEKPVIKPERIVPVPDAYATMNRQPSISPENIDRIQVLVAEKEALAAEKEAFAAEKEALERGRELQDLQEGYDELDDENDGLLEENDKLADHCDILKDTVWDYQRWLNADERTIRTQEIMIARYQEAMRLQQAEIRRLREEDALRQARSILRAWAQYQEGRRHHC
ncbi:hypothetical protein CGCS363_v014500 [Colletotrichum siamense]|uniref:uncharacterized protein n=1 Tax=Colletotrichum siamense TaxID=690259 RepID=UPI001872327A|nr:uncharacterized protein CGCS363_v014500 [Colletotrichum siamense]KAF5484715.1 hypothetical protein CGCS363_v014500 [Colletotrichum siamense]